MIYILWKIVKQAFITSLVLTYVEIGPGGEALGALIDGMKSYFMAIDWNTFFANLVHFVATSLHTTMENLRS